MKLDYRAMFEQVKAEIALRREELGTVLAKADELEDQIIGLQQTAAGLAKTLREQYVAEDELGLTEAVRRVFKQNAPRDFSALEVRSELESMGYDLAKYGNVMASIHSVMKRIEGKDIHGIGNRNGKPVFRQIPAAPPPPIKPVR